MGGRTRKRGRAGSACVIRIKHRAQSGSPRKREGETERMSNSNSNSKRVSEREGAHTSSASNMSRTEWIPSDTSETLLCAALPCVATVSTSAFSTVNETWYSQHISTKTQYCEAQRVSTKQQCCEAQQARDLGHAAVQDGTAKGHEIGEADERIDAVLHAYGAGELACERPERLFGDGDAVPLGHVIGGEERDARLWDPFERAEEPAGCFDDDH